MSNIEESKTAEPKKPVRRSSLKSGDGNNKLDPQNLLKFKGKRHSVSFGQSNTFQFKAMKAMFQESHDVDKPKKSTEEEHKKFVESRKKSIKNEFSLVKEMLKKNKNIIEELEDSDEEVKKNTDKNIKIGHDNLNEESSSSSNSEDENEKK
jgi:hypothetical protein